MTPNCCLNGQQALARLTALHDLFPSVRERTLWLCCDSDTRSCITPRFKAPSGEPLARLTLVILDSNSFERTSLPLQYSLPS